MIWRLVTTLTAALLAALAGGVFASGAIPDVAPGGVHIDTYNARPGSVSSGSAAVPHGADDPYGATVSFVPGDLCG